MNKQNQMQVVQIGESRRSNLFDVGSYARGNDVKWLGKQVKDMSREEMVCFIGQLDYHIESVARREQKR